MTLELQGHVSSDQAAALLEDIRVGSSDLIPDVYEGVFRHGTKGIVDVDMKCMLAEL